MRGAADSEVFDEGGGTAGLDRMWVSPVVVEGGDICSY